MFLLRQNWLVCMRLEDFNLHSNMFLLRPRVCPSASKTRWHLHSNMFLLRPRCQKARQSSDQSGAFCLPNNILLLKLSLSIFNNTTVCKLNLFEVVDPLEFQRHWVSTEKLYNKTCAFVFLSPKLFIQPFLLSAAENNYGIQFSIYMRL